ncbi:MAG: polysaccharide biosynthesis C-terminal domain-containing protein [Fibrobacterales bacterium]
MTQDKSFILKGTVLNLLGLIPKSAPPLLVILMARLFSQEEFGIFISIKFFVMTLSRLVVFGIDKGLIWYIPQNQKHNRPTEFNLIESYYFTSIVSVILTVLGILFISFGGLTLFPAIPNSSDTFIIITLLSLLPLMGLHCFSAALEGVRKPQYKIFLNQFAIEALGPLISILLFYTLATNYSLALGFTISNYIGLFIYLFIIRKIFTMKWSTLKLPSRDLFNYSIPIGIAEIINSLLLRVDLWMILALLGPKKAAIYSIMVTLTNAIKTIRQGYDPMIIAIVSKMNLSQNNTHLKEVASYTVNVITSIQIFIAVFVIFFPAEIMEIAGKEYSADLQTLSVLIVGNLLNSIFGLNGIILLGLGNSKSVMKANIATLIINVSLNYYLITHFGVVGAAIATVTSQIVSSFYFLYKQYQYTRIIPYEKHLLINFSIIFIIAILSFFYFDSIQSLMLQQKIVVFAASIVSIVSIFLLKRSTYTIQK